MDLSPVLLSLPGLAVSLLYLQEFLNPWSQKFDKSLTLAEKVPPLLTQSMLFASVSLLIAATFREIGLYEQRQLISSPVDDEDESFADSTKAGGILSTFIQPIRFICILLIPLGMIFLANQLLLPIRTSTLLMITLLINSAPRSTYRSLKLEQQYSMTQSIVGVAFRRYQPIIVHGICFVYDYVYSTWQDNSMASSSILGYAVLVIPHIAFLNSNTHEKFSKSVLPLIRIKTSAISSVAWLLILVGLYFENLNFKMLFVAMGSLLILLMSQIDYENIGKKGQASRLFHRYVTKENYKLILISLNVIMACVHALTINMNGAGFGNYNTLQIDMIKDSCSDFLLNFILIFTIQVPELQASEQDLDVKDKELVDDRKVSFLSVLMQLIRNEESRSIFNFLLLNLSFMFVQILYSFRSRSLSLLSDSLHMFLDCTSLFLGLLASVIAKDNIENPSLAYPFGLARIETLAGFTNGSLLLGIVFGIFSQAIQRIINPIALEKTTELLIVSILGLLVNVVGIFAFGHDHDHAHGHDHAHAHGPHLHHHTEHPHAHNGEYNVHEPEHEPGHEHEHEHEHQHEHGHSPIENSLVQADVEDHSEYENDNMHGIFLHIMADTLGSVGVVASTLFVKYFGWKLVDPLTSILIGALILISAIPLLKSSSSNLLLSLNGRYARELKEVLEQVRKIQGVKNYATPRFWPKNDSSSRLVGYLHVVYYRTENSSLIREKVNKIFASSDVIEECYIQVENEIDDCWCRTKGVFSTNTADS